MSKRAFIEDVKEAYYQHDGGCFFDPDSMRYFRCRLSQDAIESDDGRNFVFVTSERQASWRCSYPRLYTVRRLHIPADGSADVLTVGEFQEHGSRYLAWKAARAEMDRLEGAEQ